MLAQNDRGLAFSFFGSDVDPHPLAPSFEARKQPQMKPFSKLLLRDLRLILEIALLKPLQPGEAPQPVVRGVPAARIKVQAVERLRGNAVEFVATETLQSNYVEGLANVAQNWSCQLVGGRPGGQDSPVAG